MDLEIVGLVDIDTEQARSRVEEFSLSKAIVGDNLEEMIDRTDADLVFDVVVPAARVDVVTKALAKGCHVLSEKPLASSLGDARKLLERAKAAERLHAVIQNRRYIEPVRRIRSFIESGVIGDITSIHADFFLAPHFGGFREEMKHVLLLDMAIHTFDAGRFIAGENAVSVLAQEWEPKNSWWAQGASAAAFFRMHSGAIFTYRGCWCADGLMTSWESEWRIVGTRGSLSWDGYDDLRAEKIGSGEMEGLFNSTQYVEVPPYDPDTDGGVDGHFGVMRDFIEAARRGGMPETVSSENIKSLAMTLAAIDSSEMDRRVDVAI